MAAVGTKIDAARVGQRLEDSHDSQANFKDSIVNNVTFSARHAARRRICGRSDLPPLLQLGPMCLTVHSSTRSSTMKISSLSLDSQLAILSQLPSHTLLSVVPLVCARWYRLQPHACLQRRTVQLTNSPIELPEPPRHFELHPKPLDDIYATALFATFPTVTHLVIDHRYFGFETLDQQLHLLDNWAPTLVSLHLTTDANMQVASQEKDSQFCVFLDRLLVALNRMPRLKRLKLKMWQLRQPINLSVLSRLADIELNISFSDHILIPQLLQHCSANLQHLSLGFVWDFPNFQPLLTNQSICSKLGSVRIINFDSTQLAITFDRCNRIQSLCLFLITLEEYAERLHLLTKLPHLTELSLPIIQIIANPLDPVALAALVPSTHLPTLPTVRRLAIGAYSIPSHVYFTQSTQLDHVFPRLQWIQFSWRADDVRCQQCMAFDRDLNSCIDALLRPLAGIETLEVANISIEEEVYNWLPRLRSHNNSQLD